MPAEAPGTLITRARDKRNTLLTSVVRKGEVTLLDIVSTRMLGQFGFLSSVFQARPVSSRPRAPGPPTHFPCKARPLTGVCARPFRVRQIMAANQISVDVVATSEVSVSLTLDPAKLWSRQLIPTVSAWKPSLCPHSQSTNSSRANELKQQQQHAF